MSDDAGWSRDAVICPGPLRGDGQDIPDYLDAAGDASFLPRDRDDLAAMLEPYVIDKAVYELRYQLNNRPEWLGLPLEGLLQRVDQDPARPAGMAR